MKFVVSGYYGFDNIGDEAVLESIVNKLGSQHQLTILSATPTATAANYRVQAIGRFAWLSIIQAVWQSDCLLSGGGSLFQDVTSQRSFFYYLFILIIAKLLRKKTVVLGQGVGPVKKSFNQRLLGWIFKSVDLITVRDDDSFRVLKKLGIESKLYLTADLALTLPSADRSVGEKLLNLENISKPRLGVALRNNFIDQSIDISSLSNLFDGLASALGYQIIFLPFHCPQDLQMAKQIMSNMKTDSKLVFRVSQPAEMLALVSQLDVMLGMRLHALIFAAKCAVPLVGLAYDPKVVAFMQQINQPCLNLSETDKINNCLAEVIKQREQIKISLAQRVAQLAAKSENNYDLLQKHIIKDNK